MKRYKIRQKLSILLPREMAHVYLYNRFHEDKIINFNNPLTYDQKIHWLMVKVYDKSYGKYVDKYEVREYVEQCGLKKLLIPIIGVWNSIEEVDFSNLPEKYILKTTHGSQEDFYEIILNNQDVDINKLINKFSYAVKVNFAWDNAQYQYGSIKPRIICEQLLETEKQKRLTDYKVVCSYGKAYAILVCSDRDKGRDYYSTDWHYLNYVKDEFKSEGIIKRPRCIEEMIEYAEILSKPFPLARIDFYEVNQKVYFGEITLTPSAGHHEYLTKYGQIELGKMITLPRL